jgi:hypothetical protein
MQRKTRKSPCISLDSFGGIETFQRVTAETSKKIRRFSTRVSGCPPSAPSGSALSPGRLQRGVEIQGFRSTESIQAIRFFSQYFCRLQLELRGKIDNFTKDLEDDLNENRRTMMQKVVRRAAECDPHHSTRYGNVGKLVVGDCRVQRLCHDDAFRRVNAKLFR